MLLKDRLLELKHSRKAILATNFYNFETLTGILLATSESQTEVILQLSESSIKYLKLHTAVEMARSAMQEHNVKGWIHLDHGSSFEMTAQCLDAGFDSVMIDASEQSFSENVKVTSAVVKLAQQYKANVEAELGYIAKLGQGHEHKGFTQPADALKFVRETGVNALAVAIGSAHGFYKEPPQLDISLLASISTTVSVPLVLHGSSGIPDKMLQEAIRNGISKVNLATETKNVFMHQLKSTMSITDDIDLRHVFPEAIQAVKTLITEKFNIVNNS